MSNPIPKIAAWYADFNVPKSARNGDDVLKFIGRIFVFMLVFGFYGLFDRLISMILTRYRL